MTPKLIQAKKLIESVQNSPLSLEERKKLSIELAALILEEAENSHTPKERKTQAELARMMGDPMGKAFTTAMTDQCFRSNNYKRIANQMVFLLSKFGVPKFLSWFKRLQLSVFQKFGSVFPSFFVPLATYFLRKQTRSVIIPGEKGPLSRHIHKRKQEGIRLNLNHLGEAILGEKEAERRLHIYLEDLLQDDIDYVSIKISTIYSQINLLAYEQTIQETANRLRVLYRAAMQNSIGGKNKFVNLDMEEYKDLHLTKDIFMRVLSEPEFKHLSAGIVLQAYLPDSYELLQELTVWAVERLKKGGAPIKVRIVKGANMCMEQHEASVKGWEQAPYYSKVETDANYKRMVLFALKKEHAPAVNIGVASHNVFDIAFAFLLRSEQGIEEYISFEMLEGMADHMRRVVHTLAGDILLYCAVATKEDFQSAIAYLIRRLDENTGIDNFLAHSFGLTTTSEAWQKQIDIFTKACELIDTVSAKPNRRQDRSLPPQHLPIEAPFTNEPDTDFSLEANRVWLDKIVAEHKTKTYGDIPLVINGKEYCEAKKEGIDPSDPSRTLYHFTVGDEKRMEEAMQCGVDARKEWASRGIDERCTLIHKVAEKIREHRGELIGIMIGDGGKNPIEADVEISEAIDFCEYYLRSMKEFATHTDVTFVPKGTVLITPPWNFPCAIPLGGCIASLVTGNTVLFKPSQETCLTGYRLAQLMWDAGIPKEVLQFIQCEDEPTGSKLIQDERISCVILTGATTTAELFMKMRPDLHLCAETGGKNAMIITALADRDLAIKELVHSAFGHAGQKCSAASLAILEREVYDDPHFIKQLKDAVESIKVGSAWNTKSKVTPLIVPPGETLKRGLTQLDRGEEWIVKPNQDPENPHLWSPGVKKGVKPGSFSHQNEFFGPVLSLIRAQDLDDALHIANGTKYGLTSGIQSLDEREQKKWQKHIVAGNCYINRGTTGAIVQRQAFGGTKASCFGPGSKAGGPNYLQQFMDIQQTGVPEHKHSINDFVNNLGNALDVLQLSQDEMGSYFAAISSYAYWMNRGRQPEDKSRIIGQDNFFSYDIRKHLWVRINEDAPAIDFMRVFACAMTAGVSLTVSWASPPKGINWRLLLPTSSIVEESEESFVKSIREGTVTRVRYLGKPCKAALHEAAQNDCYIDHAPVVSNGRIELLHYVREISTSCDYHRYGNLGTREGEQRTPLKRP